MSVLVAVEPDCWRRPVLAEAVARGGGTVCTPDEASALVWAEPTQAHLIGELVDANPGIEWVQLPYAGIEPVVDIVTARPAVEWYCGKGVYAEPVAEHALMLALAGMRGMATYARASDWTAPEGRNLLGASVTVLGGGGITESLLRLLEPFGCDVAVVRNRPTTMSGAARVVGPDELPQVLPCTDVLFLALALTPDTAGIIGSAELAALPDHAWIVNVARGGHIVTEDLVEALQAGQIGGAALDVTDPEPLPDGHPLWSLPNCLITPHIGNTPEMGLVLLAERVTANVALRVAGAPLVGPVYLDLGY
ncbi:D-isomer specific 2-hydroxyacid dehydrogenase family protein [Candidatus Poriferisodalis multihospitum]|uniref:D-isomer specific 2-hydroxyacid dehydrogenase family protein n=1 Tax=Candidatus Poriferisodalis multihospitum TaxID=2983191 RepID=UPI002B258009|nr:D-isomer specific 2-hydroxyacid dehydrogenase family protein [Candidatus Poriferisodalis multihospitum]